MGLNIMLPFEQEANPVMAGDHKLVHMKYFFTRKLMFVKESNAMCLLPGGFGTLDLGDYGLRVRDFARFQHPPQNPPTRARPEESPLLVAVHHHGAQSTGSSGGQ